ncbi:hypothetical protein QLQ09_24025 [Brucella sp. NM4]|uniref:ATP-binding protein n=1 Tax=Brucella sp. NM4 TaxID=3045175 RepID=UPI0024BCC4FA|nr:hypothetical protein [Brucella sp. NM4]WHS33909.1 hypothetical protein QLQ09_24025 [Brucella sp. NM4]
MDLLNVQEMARRLDDRFSVLTKGRRTAMPRQQTLRATLDWSHELLSDTEKAIFRRLSVFRSSFEIDSAIAVCLEPGREDFVVFDALTALVDKSLVTMDRRDRSSLYRLLDTTRFYSAEKLGKGDEYDGVMRRHGQQCLKLFSSEITAWDGKNPAQWLAANSWRVDDLRAVFDWAFTTGDHKLGIDLVVASASIWFHPFPAVRVSFDRAPGDGGDLGHRSGWIGYGTGTTGDLRTRALAHVRADRRHEQRLQARGGDRRPA